MKGHAELSAVAAVTPVKDFPQSIQKEIRLEQGYDESIHFPAWLITYQHINYEYKVEQYSKNDCSNQYFYICLGKNYAKWSRKWVRAIVAIHLPTSLCMWGLIAAMLCDNTRIYNRFLKLPQTNHNKNIQYIFFCSM